MSPQSRRRRYRVSHVIFDVDGTLVDWDASYATAITAAAEELSGHLGRPVAPAALRQARELVFAEPAWSGRLLREVRDESFRRVLVAAGEPSPAVLEAVSTTYFRARDEALRAYDDVEPALAELSARGFTLIAATNGNAALGRLAIARHLSHIHFAAHDGISKPAPRFFAGVLERAGGRAAEAISVGDSIENDIEPPRALGMHALLIDRASTARDADVPRIESLEQLPDLLELVSAD